MRQTIDVYASMVASFPFQGDGVVLRVIDQPADNGSLPIYVWDGTADRYVLPTPMSAIIDNLNSLLTDASLSAHMGKVLNDAIVALSQRVDNLPTGGGGTPTPVADDLVTANPAVALSANQGVVLSGQITSLGTTKADAGSVTTALAAKADTTAVNTALALKADASALASKVDIANFLDVKFVGSFDFTQRPYPADVGDKAVARLSINGIWSWWRCNGVAWTPMGPRQLVGFVVGSESSNTTGSMVAFPASIPIPGGLVQGDSRLEVYTDFNAVNTTGTKILRLNLHDPYLNSDAWIWNAASIAGDGTTAGDRRLEGTTFIDCVGDNRHIRTYLGGTTGGTNSPAPTLNSINGHMNAYVADQAVDMTYDQVLQFFCQKNVATERVTLRLAAVYITHPNLLQ